MDNKKIIFIFLSISIMLLFSSTVMAEENVTGGNTIIVDGSASNQMINPTIQSAIDNASAGDTIEITGGEYNHCHFIVDKQLTIITNTQTILNTCPSNTKGSNGTGIFYFTPNASGSVLSGFVLTNDAGKNGIIDPYSVYINNASDIKIANVTVKNVYDGSGINIVDSDNIIMDSVSVKKSTKGIAIENSENIQILNSEIKSNENAGIYIGNNVSNVLIKNNIISNNNWKGIYLASASYVNITSNEIYENKNKILTNNQFSGTGIYINTSIVKLNILGNHVYNNGAYGIFTSPEAMDSLVDENVEVIDGNLFYGHETRAVYAEDNAGCTGTIYVWSNFYSTDLMCPSTAYAPGVLVRVDNYKDMIMSNITEISDRVYSVSFVRKDTGEVLTDIGSFNVTFFLNKQTTRASIESGDIAKSVRVINGTATVDFTDFSLKTGKNSIIAIAQGKGPIDFDKTASRLCSILYVDNGTEIIIISKISSEDITVIHNSNMTYVASLKDLDENPIVDQNINVIIGNKLYSRTTDENGLIKIDLNLKSGTYNAVAMFCGDENYKCTNTMSSITIIPSIITSDLIKTYKNDSQFDSEFYDVNGELLANQEIQFNINGVNYSRTTNENGIARMNINLNPGNYSITSINPFTNESIANTICVLPTITDNDDLVKYYRNNSQFCVKVTNLDGSLAKDGEVIFNINGVFYQRQVNSSGIAKLNINLNPGEYIITSEYNGCKVSNLITVLPFLVAGDMVKEYKTVDQFKIKVLDATGNSLANAQVTFNINGVFYNRTSDLEGIAALNINLIPGKYIITSFYNSLYVSNYIEVLKTLSVGENLTNAQIQQIIDNADGKVAIRFEGNKYDDISLNINHPLLITGDNTELNGKLNSQVISVNSDDVIVKNININANNASGIILNDVANVEIMNNVISNINKFSGNGISILGSQVSIVNNTIKNFNYALYSNSTSENIILNNRFVENNNTIFISSQNQEYNITNNTVCIPCLFNCTDGVCQFVFDEGACVPCLLNCTDGVCQFVFDEGACVPCLLNCTDGVCQFVFDEGACVPCLLNCTDGVCQFIIN